MKTDRYPEKDLFTRFLYDVESMDEFVVGGAGLREALNYASFKITSDSCVSMRHKGHNYITDAMVMIFLCGPYQTGLTKVIYPAIAARYNVSSKAVEAGIRAAINAAWQAHLERLQAKSDETQPRISILSVMRKFDHRPTNSEYLNYSAMMLRQTVQMGPEDFVFRD